MQQLQRRFYLRGCLITIVIDNMNATERLIVFLARQFSFSEKNSNFSLPVTLPFSGLIKFSSTRRVNIDFMMCEVVLIFESHSDFPLFIFL